MTSTSRNANPSAVLGLILAALTASAGSARAQAPAPVPAPVPAPAQEQSPQQIFDSKYIGFAELITGSLNGRRSMRPRFAPYQGVYHRPLKPEEFYAAVGRPDYAEQYLAKRRRRIGLIAAGGALMGAGAIALGVGTGVFIATNVNPTIVCGFTGPCTTPSYNPTPLYIGLGIFAFGAAGGLTLLLVGVLQNPHPVPLQEAHRLADEYNQGLRQQLGLAAGALSMLRRATFAPTFGPQGAAVAATTTF